MRCILREENDPGVGRITLSCSLIVRLMLTLSDPTINPPTLNNGRNLTIRLTEDKRENRNIDVDSLLLTETLRNA